MRIANNIMAMNTHRFYTNNNNAVSKSAEKLSSGYKINRAGDDAAGLAISEKMRSQIRGMNMAKKNSQDAISLVQTAEGALQEVHSMLQRMSELAIQSATGTNEEKIDRAALQQEFKNLQDEINQVASTTTFNDMNLLDGSLSMNGAAGGSPLTATLGDKGWEGAAAGTNTDAADLSGLKTDLIASAITADENTVAGDVTVSFAKNAATNKLEMKVGENVIGSADLAASAAWDGTAPLELQFTSANGADLGKVTVAKSVAAAGTPDLDEAVTGLEAVTAAFTVSDGAQAPAEATKASISIDLSKSTTDIADGNSATIKLGDGAGETLTLTATGADITAANIADEFAKANATVTVNEVEYNVTAENGVLKFEAAEAGAIEEGKGIDPAAVEYKNNGTADAAVGADAITSVDGADADAAGATGGLQIQVGPKSANTLSIGVDNMNCTSLGIQSLDIGKQSTANAAIDVVYTAINKVSTQRAELGALQNRLDHKISNLANTAENLSAAESRIRDVDIAEEMTNFTKNNILSQAATAMLAQANSLPQNVLSLLR